LGTQDSAGGKVEKRELSKPGLAGILSVISPGMSGGFHGFNQPKCEVDSARVKNRIDSLRTPNRGPAVATTSPAAAEEDAGRSRPGSGFDRRIISSTAMCPRTVFAGKKHSRAFG
jgi:hypothetical protein